MAVLGRHGVLRLLQESANSPNINTRNTSAQVVNWVLNLQNSEIDTTALGDQFTDAIKSGIVSGKGSIDFLVERLVTVTDTEDSIQLLNLLLLSDVGCKANAEFWMIRNRPIDNCNILAPGSLYYNADIIITSSAINTSADNLINGSVEFITVGEVTLNISST